MVGGPFEYQTFWTINSYCPYFRPPFEYRTFWQPDTNLPFQYQTCLVLRWLLLSSILISVVLQVDFFKLLQFILFSRWRQVQLSDRNTMTQHFLIRSAEIYPTAIETPWRMTLDNLNQVRHCRSWLMCAYLVVFEQFFKNRTTVCPDFGRLSKIKLFCLVFKWLD